MKLEAFGWTIWIFKHRQSATRRHAKWRKKAVKERKCVVCTKRVRMKNKWTGEWYRKCKKCRLHENALCKIRRKLIN